MISMSIAYEETGRTSQKQRTRAALITAARELVAQGATPTVEQAAAAAAISRTTAYRYFSNQRELLVAAHPETETRSLLPMDAPGDPEARLDIAIAEFTRLIVETEPQQRTTLRLSLEPHVGASPPLLLRQGRAIAWIEEALAPLRAQMSADELRRLVLAIRSVTGIEAFIWLVDVARLSREEATELQRWSARAMLQAAKRDPAALG